MTLTFLGQRYEAIAIELESISTEYKGSYRGNSVTFARSRPSMPINCTLTYRGVTYQR